MFHFPEEFKIVCFPALIETPKYSFKDQLNH